MGMVWCAGVLCCEVFVWVWCDVLALGWCFEVNIAFVGNGYAWCGLYFSGWGANDGRAGHYNMGLVARKPVFGVSDKARLKPVSSTTETSYKK